MTKLYFGLCLAVLLSGTVRAQEARGVKVEVLAKTTASWDGTPLPEYGPGTPEVTILKVTVPPGARMPMHQHPTISAGVLLKGELTVVTEDNRTFHLKAGKAAVELVNRWHGGRNEGDEPAELIIFYAGTKGKPNTVGERGE